MGKKRVRRSFIEIVSVIFEKWHQKKAACEQEAFESLSLGGLSGEIIDRERRDTNIQVDPQISAVFTSDQLR